jgi:hypothetical protein
MFGAEPEEKMTQEDLEEFEKHVEEQHKKVLKGASIAVSIFLLNILVLLRSWRGILFTRIGRVPVKSFSFLLWVLFSCA